MKYPIQLFSGLFICVLLLFAGCSDDNPASPTTTGPPKVPPVRSMQINIPIFNQRGLSADAVDSATNSHFEAAFQRAIFAKLIIDVQLAFPRALLKIADDVKPELNDDGEWIWSFNSQHNEENIGVSLVAKSKNGGIYWAFYLTNSMLNMDNELFFDGITKDEGRQGTWYYYGLFSSSYESNEPTSQLKWLIQGQNSVTLTLTVLKNSDFASKDDQIKYTREGVIKKLKMYKANQGETIIISWNSDTKAGYIIAPDYNSGEKACWNLNFENTPCSKISL